MCTDQFGIPKMKSITTLTLLAIDKFSLIYFMTITDHPKAFALILNVNERQSGLTMLTVLILMQKAWHPKW